MAIRTLLLVLLLAGCAGLNKPPAIIEKPVEVRVEIPIPVPCVDQEIPLPDLAVPKLDSNAQAGDVAQAYVQDYLRLQEVIMQQKKLLDACRIK